MRLLIAGQGAEDVRRPLWCLVERLRRQGHACRGLDISEAATLSKYGDPWPTVKWLIEDLRPQAALVLHERDAREGDDAVLVELLRSAGVFVVSEGLSAPSGSLGGLRLKAAIDTDLLAPRVAASTSVSYDAVVLGEPSVGRISVARGLRAAGLDVATWGRGWDAVESVGGAAGSRPPYPLLAETLNKARIAVAMPGNRPGEHILDALEAAACGLPVVATSDIDGFLTVDSEALAAGPSPKKVVHVVRNLLNDEVTRAALASAGRSRVEREWSWNVNWPSSIPATPPARRLLRAADRAPKVSVVMATYQVAEYLGASIESILHQTFRDFELIILNDGSTDNTASVAARYLGDSRVRLCQQQNIGQTGRLDIVNRYVIDMARGGLIARMDSDDIAHPDRLRRQVARFDEQPSLDLLHTGGIAIDAAGAPGGTIWSLSEPYGSLRTARALMAINIIAHPTVMIRSSAFDRVGHYEQGFAFDYEFWLRASGYLHFGYLPQRLVYYRSHPKSGTNAPIASPTARQEFLRLRRRAHSFLSLKDLYPELGDRRQNPREWALAHLDLGNRMLRESPDVELAVEEYQAALETDRSLMSAVAHNLSVSALLCGEPPTRSAYHRLVHDSDDVPLPLRSAFDGALSGRTETTIGGLLVGPSHFGSHLARYAPRPGERDWSGAQGDSRTRLLLAVDWNDPAPAGPIIRAWCRYLRREDPVTLTIPLDGADPSDAIAALGKLLSPADDVDSAGEVALEDVDDPSLYPSGWWSMMVNANGAHYYDRLADVVAWIRGLRTALDVKAPRSA